MENSIYSIKSYNKKSRFFSVILPFIPWLNIYSAGIPGVSIGYLVLIVSLIVCLCSKGSKRNDFKYEGPLFFFIVACTTLPFSAIISESFVFIQIANRILKFFLLIFTAIFIYPRYLDNRYFKKSFSYLGTIFAIALMIQFILYISIGRSIEFKLPLLSYSNEWSDVKDFADIMVISGRMTSVFLEPSHYCYYVLPLIILLLFDDVKKISTKKMVLPIFLSLTVLLSASSAGTISLIVIWGVFILYFLFNNKKSSKNIAIILVCAVSIILGIVLLKNNDTVSFALKRLLPSYGSSQTVWGKIEGGKEEFDKLPTILKIIGHGLGNHNSFFMTGFFYTLYCTGVLGVSILFVWVCNSFFKTNMVGKITLIVFVMLMFVTMNLYDISLLLYLVLIKRRNSNEKYNIFSN